MNIIDYKVILEDDYFNRDACTVKNRTQYISRFVFDFETFNYEYCEFLGKMALDVCKAIRYGKTVEYVNLGKSNCLWYQILLNMPFFLNSVDYGSSMTSAWFDPSNASSLGVRRIIEVKIEDGIEYTKSETFEIDGRDEFEKYIDAIIAFADEENKQWVD